MDRRPNDLLQALNLKRQELTDLSLALDFLSDVARLAEQAAEVDPEDKQGLLFASRRVQNAFSSILDVLHAHAMGISESLERLHQELSRALEPVSQNSNPKEEVSS